MTPGRAASSAWMAALTLAAVPTGTVDLSTTTLKPVMWRPMLRAAASTYCRSALPSSSGGVPTAMNWMSPKATAAATSVVKRQPAGVDVGLDQFAQAGLMDGHAAAVEGGDLGGVDVEAADAVAQVRQAGAGDQADVAGADDGDVHVVCS